MSPIDDGPNSIAIRGRVSTNPNDWVWQRSTSGSSYPCSPLVAPGPPQYTEQAVREWIDSHAGTINLTGLVDLLVANLSPQQRAALAIKLFNSAATEAKVEAVPSTMRNPQGDSEEQERVRQEKLARIAADVRRREMLRDVFTYVPPEGR